jgi:hypothetical protein
MNIAPGTRLGSFEFVAQIGAGGVGEVYVGPDNTLKHDSLLLLPPQWPLDASKQV